MRWAEIKVTARPLAAETVASILIEEGCRGAAIASPSASFDGEVQVSGYLPVDDLFEERVRSQAKRIRDMPRFFDVATGSLEITVRPVDEIEWSEAWRAHYKPLVFGKVVVQPSWEHYDPQPDQVVVQIDPGMAFGTGQHPTTALCLLALQEHVRAGNVVADVGTGSGILAIAAAKLGARRVYAIDADSVAVHVAEQNVERNGLEGTIEVREANSPSEIPECVDVLVANIVADVIMDMAEQAAAALKPGGIMISSGIVRERAPDAIRKLESAGLETLKTSEDGSWIAVHSRKLEGSV